jgi:LCP family protein required for cell wall assembly
MSARLPPMAERAERRPTPPQAPARRPTDLDHARRLRPDSRPTDGRRLLSGLFSSILPCGGQLFNGRRRAAAVFGLPILIVLAIALLIVQSDRPTMLLARVIAPSVLGLLLGLNIVVLVWRTIAVLHAFADRRYPRRPGRLGVIGLVVLLLVTAVPHVAAWSYGTAAQTTFAQIFSGQTGSVSGAPSPSGHERINILLIGTDSGPGRTETLSDSIIVVSLDPVGRTVSMVSVPRDLASVPLGNGSVFGPKINSLMSWADRHPTEFPGGGVKALEGAIGSLLGIPIHYYATIDLGGFVKMVDAVGGVDIKVTKALSDPNYGGFGVGPGWSIEPGLHHLDGANALAYTRIRKSTGESDFTRAARQQEVLVALRNRAVSAGILFNLPPLLSAIGGAIRTDLPADRLPELAALAEQIGGSSTTQVVLGGPMIKSGGPSPYGSTFVPVPVRIAAMTRVVFGPPGQSAVWPVPSGGPAVSPLGSAAP